MRTFKLDLKKIDKKYLIGVIITFLCAIICGIVLCKNVISNVYFKNFSTKYIYNVFNFKTGTLVFAYFFSSLVFGYVFLLFSYYFKLKYVSLIFVFIRSLFICVYVISLFSVNVFGGALAVILIYIPTSLLSLCSNVFISEFCCCVNKRYVFLLPLVLSLICAIAYIILLNVIFRLIISIV